MLIKVKLTRSENLDYYGKDEIEIDIEEYLKGVVPAEVGNAALEAGKAQAVAARTFALYRYQSKGSISDKSSTDQAFRASRFSSAYARAHQAVEDTKGEVLYYNNKIVTNAHYSAMNGGRTYSSEEKWGGKRAYLIAQEDPWDYAVSQGKKNGHGVGMSQTGAKYAASIGIKYDEILAFYYPGTEIRKNYGEVVVTQPSEPTVGTTGGQPQGGNVMSQYEKYTNLHFVEFLKAMVGQPYWYGTCVYKCTTSTLKSKTNQYPSHYGSDRTAKYKAQIAAKMVSADCVGLGKGYNWTYGGEGVIESIGTDKTFKSKYGNNCPDKSANGMFTYAKSKGLKYGKIATIPEVPGLAVRKDGHVGYYIGNGEVVEAYGFSKGIIITKLKSRPWTDWYEFPGIKYISGDYKPEVPETKPEEEAPKPIATAVVTTVSGRLNLRAGKSTSSSILARIPKGQKINIYEREETWSKTYFSGKYGYVMNSFLTFEGEEQEYDLGDRLPLKEGMRGTDVEELQEILLDLGYQLTTGNADGVFGPETTTAVKDFERDHGETADGIITKDLLEKMVAAQGKDDNDDDNEIVPTLDYSANPTIRKGAKNNYVTILQQGLKKLGYDLGTYGDNRDGIDGDYGSKTVNAVRKFQTKANIKVDGICGPKTWEALAKALV